jgi:hypothetical protein
MVLKAAFFPLEAGRIRGLGYLAWDAVLARGLMEELVFPGNANFPIGVGRIRQVGDWRSQISIRHPGGELWLY